MPVGRLALPCLLVGLLGDVEVVPFPELHMVRVIESSDSYTVGKHVYDLRVLVFLFRVPEGGGGCVGEAGLWKGHGHWTAVAVYVGPSDDGFRHDVLPGIPIPARADIRQ